MNTYKIGNKVNCTIRAYRAGKMGSRTMTYAHEPYTILPEIEVSISFHNTDVRDQHPTKELLRYHYNAIDTVTLSNIPLTRPILELMFKEHNRPFISIREEMISTIDNKIYFNNPSIVYQVFVFDNLGMLEAAYDDISANYIDVQKAESVYSIYYYYLGERSISLEQPENTPVTLDLEVIGNKDDETHGMHIHIEHAIIRISGDISFDDSNSNVTDLVFEVISSEDNYIVLD